MVYGEVPSLEPHRLAFRYGVCIDAVYHLPATYALAARWRSEPDLARKAVRIAVDCHEVLRCDSGWAQWYDPTRKRNNGVAWTVVLGWAVLGLLDLVNSSTTAHDEAAEVAGQVLELLGRDAGTRRKLGRGARPRTGRHRDTRPHRSTSPRPCIRRQLDRHPAAGCARAGDRRMPPGARRPTARTPVSPPMCFPAGMSRRTRTARPSRRRGHRVPQSARSPHSPAHRRRDR